MSQIGYVKGHVTMGIRGTILSDVVIWGLGDSTIRISPESFKKMFPKIDLGKLAVDDYEIAVSIKLGRKL